MWFIFLFRDYSCRFVANHIDSPAELQSIIERKLAEQAEKMTLSISPIDTEAVAFMEDYYLGDKVAVVVDGVPIADHIREIKIALEKERGEVVTPVVGTPGAKSIDGLAELFNLNSRLFARIDALERST